MPANLNDDLTPEEKEGMPKVIQSTNQEPILSEIDCAQMKPGFQSFSTVEDSESFKEAPNMEPRVNIKDTSYNVRKSPPMEQISAEKMVTTAMQCTNELEQCGSHPCYETVIDDQVAHTQNVDDDNNNNKTNKIHSSPRDTSGVVTNSSTFEGMDLRNTVGAGTCNVEKSCYIEKQENENTVHTLSVDSTTFQNKEKTPELSYDEKTNSKSYSDLRNTAYINGTVQDSGGKQTDSSNSEESNVESDTAETNNESPEQQFTFEDPSVPKYFNNYIDGLRVCGDSRCPLDSKPSWLDVEKYRRGQKVALKYLFGLQFAQMLSLLVVFSGPGGVEPLIFTGKSDTPFKAFKRYLSTALRVRSWYLDDLWNPQTEGHKNLTKVRAMHETVRKNLEATDPKERDKRSTLSGRCESGCPAIWSPLHNKLQEDFEGTCPYPRISENEFLKFYKSRICVNQTEMGVTQFGFVGLFVKYPAYFGAHNITDDELDSFVHLWRCIGYLLGIEDKYNFCNGDLENVRQKSTDLIDFFLKPGLRSITQDWEHMSRCVTEGVSLYVPGVTFEVSLLYLCNMLGLYTPRLWEALTFGQKIMYYLTKFTFWFLLRLPGSLEYHNSLVNKCLKIGENVPPSQLQEWEKKKYPYEENAVCT